MKLEADKVDSIVKVFLHCLLSVIHQEIEPNKYMHEDLRQKKKRTLENIISTNRPVADGNDLCLPVERSSTILLAALLLSVLQKAKLLIFTVVCVLEVDPFILIPPSHKSMKNFSSCPPCLIQR